MCFEQPKATWAITTACCVQLTTVAQAEAAWSLPTLLAIAPKETCLQTVPMGSSKTFIKVVSCMYFVLVTRCNSRRPK